MPCLVNVGILESVNLGNFSNINTMIILVADFADRLFEPMKYETQAEKRREQMKVFDIAEMEEVNTCLAYFIITIFSPIISS